MESIMFTISPIFSGAMLKGVTVNKDVAQQYTDTADISSYYERK